MSHPFFASESYHPPIMSDLPRIHIIYYINKLVFREGLYGNG